MAMLTPGQETYAFFAEIGTAITLWANVENSLKNVVLSCFDNSNDLNHRMLALGFFSIENFRSRLDFADAIVRKKYITSTHINEWPSLVDRIRKASAQRNKMVHRGSAYYPDSKTGRRMVLVPWIFTKSKKKTSLPKPPDGSLGILDLMKISNEFRSLYFALENFRARLLDKSEPFSASAEQALRPPTIHSLKRLIHLILEGPH